MSPAQVVVVAVVCLIVGGVIGLVLAGTCQSAKVGSEPEEPVRPKPIIKTKLLGVECPKCGSGLYGGRSSFNFFALCEHEECGFYRMASTTHGLMREIAEARS